MKIRNAKPVRVARILSWAIGLGWSAVLSAADDPASRIVILANSDDTDSLRVARHYARVRAVPAANIIALKMPLAEGITWREFVTQMWQPLIERLVADRWIDATPMALTDALGRRKYAPRDHRIAALVICRGVPLKIANDPVYLTDPPAPANRREFRTNAGAVDAELSLLAQPNYPITGFVTNPLFQNEHPTPFETAQVVRVARLDGPTVADALALVDRAVEAEQRGLAGRGYVDIANRDKMGDAWLEGAAKQIAALGFDLAVDREPAIMPVTARCDAPAFYFGWYSSEMGGPFALPGFKFPPGAVAVHIQSFSAASLRQPTGAWTSAFIARGVTATVGNVHEPYLPFTHRPDLLMRALARGFTWVDAAYFALPVLSWQAIVIGDPLYRPLAISTDAQIERRSDLPDELRGYVVLRKMRQLESEGGQADAQAFALSEQRRKATLAVGFELARRQRDTGDVRGAGEAVEIFANEEKFATHQWAMAREAALLLEAGGHPQQARAVWRALLSSPGFPDELRKLWLPDAIRAAMSAKDAAQVGTWREMLQALNSKVN